MSHAVFGAYAHTKIALLFIHLNLTGNPVLLFAKFGDPIYKRLLYLDLSLFF